MTEEKKNRRELADERVRDFLEMHGEVGRLTLDAYNVADPLGVYEGEADNPNEYVGYADRFLRGLTQFYTDEIGDDLKMTDPSLIYDELVRRSFRVTQVVPNEQTGKAEVEFYQICWVVQELTKRFSRNVIECFVRGLKKSFAPS